MNRFLLGAAILAALSISTPALAEEEPAHEGEHHAEAQQGEHKAEAHHAEGHHGPVIQNWWSWDYGPNAKDPAHKHWPPPFGYAIVNFGIFLAIMWKLAGKNIAQMVRDRHDRIKKDLEEAARLQKAAQGKLEEYGRRVKDVEREVETLLEQVRKEAEADRARIIAAAEEQAKKIKEDAQKQIEAEIARARTELRRGVIEAAMASAEEALKKNIGADDQRKMAEKYVAEVERSGRPS
jgi:F-type H+-transporting ATPase subunit b